MKVICFIDSLNTGGAQKQLVAVAQGLKQMGEQVIVVILHPLYELKGELNKNGIPIILINKKSFLGRFYEFRRLIIEEKPRAVISFMNSPNLISELVRLSVVKLKWKLIVSERRGNPVRFTIITKLRMSFHILSDAVTTNSQRMNNQIIQSLPFLKNKIHVIYNIVSGCFYPIPQLCNSTPIIHIIANYRKEKNIFLILRIVEILKEKGHKFNVRWFGHTFFQNGIPTDQSQEYLKALAEIDKKKLRDFIQLDEFTSEVDQLFKTPDAILLASTFEGFPNAICEAMAWGKVVLVSDVSDLSLWIKNKKNGFVFKIESEQNIIEAFEWLFSLSDEEKGDVAIMNNKLALDLFSKEKNCESYLKLIQQ